MCPKNFTTLSEYLLTNISFFIMFSARGNGNTNSRRCRDRRGGGGSGYVGRRTGGLVSYRFGLVTKTVRKGTRGGNTTNITNNTGRHSVIKKLNYIIPIIGLDKILPHVNRLHYTIFFKILVGIEKNEHYQ